MKNNNEHHPSNGPLNEIKKENIKAILFDLVVPAIDSATNLVKWSLASLIKNPQKMKKLQDEIKSVVGMNTIIEEKHIPKLRYLDMVIEETFRLYPIVFAPHEARQDISFDGYKIPKGSQIFLNLWAIARDPTIWSDNCNEFYPERFLNDDIDTISGQDFRLAPFGFGRRRCPGSMLGLLNVKVLLSQLVHSFDWEMPHGNSPQDFDMTEKFGLVMSMVNDLVLIPKYRFNLENKIELK
ncbi:cytochrome P450 CYP736A12-like [Silene latifolia]|uniref:cytochrome P450 CYP736A12-like n=1 Tax=Silene latifolia TaxID=37657 RepID=UPI003D778090